MPQPKLNVLWISFEDTSPRFGCYGDAVARTPNVDRLAAGGCVYPNTFAVAGVCAPARCAVITGMYPTYIGSHHMRTTHQNRFNPEMATPYECVPPHYVRLIPEYFRAAGYYCTNNVKTDYQFGSPVTAWDELSNEAHWRNRPDPDQPFFAVFNNTATHESGMWDEKFEGKPETDPASVTVPPYLPDTPRVRETIARQYDRIADTDAWAGELLGQLEEDGLVENTVVFLWSDHGEGLPRAKRWPYDQGIRVPMIVRDPAQVEPGTVDDRLVSTLDLGPTILSLAGLDVPPHLQGRPFVGPHAEPRDSIYASRDRFDESYDQMRAVRDGRYKYIRHYYPGRPYFFWIPYRDRHPINRELWRLENTGELEGVQRRMFERRPAEELYDVRADPWEVHNLAGDPDHAEALDRLRGELDGYLLRYDRFGDMDEAAMKRMWWPGGEQPTTSVARAYPYNQDHHGQTPLEGGQKLAAPLTVQLHSSTQGASINWALEDADQPRRWLIYADQIHITEPGDYMLHTIAHRIGFKPSAAQRIRFTVVGGSTAGANGGRPNPEVH